jgi:hypothetical protein
MVVRRGGSGTAVSMGRAVGKGGSASGSMSIVKIKGHGKGVSSASVWEGPM